jgi:glycosyltransferase involved in cell wall biosynthesis
MKVILISSGSLPCPPVGYGGLEQVVYDLAVGLKSLGHEVSVVAPTESILPDGINLIDCGPCKEHAQQWEHDAYTKYRPMMFSEEFKDAIWHDHTWTKGAYISKIENPKLHVCSTLHGMLPYTTPPPVQRPSMIGISKHHADSISAGLGIPVRYVYNGINLDKYKMGEDKRADRWLFLARMTPFKGAHVFVDLMKQLQLKGDLIGDDTMVEDKEYVHRLLMACNDYPSVRYWGGVPRSMAIDFFRKSKAYVLPCGQGWQEPFGLTVIESQACGTPVLATASGAIPELIVDGKTGFVVKSQQDLRQIIESGVMDSLSSSDCRENAEKFSLLQMAKNYANLYQELLTNGGW